MKLMKKSIRISLTILSLGFLNLPTYAQKADKTIARVNYKLTHIEDTTNRDKPHTENMLLVVGNNASVFTSLDKINRNKEMEASVQQQMKEQAGSGSFNLKLNNFSTKPTTNIDIYQFTNEKKRYINERLINNYLVDEKVEPIQWKISKDTANFHGVKCQKAIANYKGREWIAWFSQDYPMSAGPWKLGGLPGLIIQAHDKKNEVVFEFDGIELVKPNSAEQKTEDISMGPNTRIIGLSNNVYYGEEIKIPSDATIITPKEMDKLKEIREKDPEGFQKSQLASLQTGMGVRTGTASVSPNQISSVTVNTAPSGGTTKRPVRVINNPIELPVKK
ncbi:MAG: GLPGLI family protein [Pedobacter sp.]|nr:MAG: GLPGLI family protein [Pedobacter sp.]